MEGVGEFRDHFRCIARRVDRDEERLDLRAEVGRILFELLEARHRALDVGRADVGAEGIAEIDDAVLARKIAPRNFAAVFADEGEIAPDGSAGQRRFFCRSGIAGGEKESGQGNSEFVGHDSMVHGLLSARIQGQANCSQT